MALKLGLIGFGEVGRTFARGLRGHADLRGLYVFDTLLKGDRSELEATYGVTACRSLEALVAESDIILSTVTAATALEVARAASGALAAGKVYVDFNSVSPASKQAIGGIVEATGAAYIEAAIMAAVPALGLQVPILMCGPNAEAIARFERLGFNVRHLGPEIGRASATKMFRSILVKGLEALVLECFLAAGPYDVFDDVLDYVEQGYPGLNWGKTADFLIGRSLKHGARRAQEMVEVAQTLEQMGIEPLMSRSASRRLGEFATLVGDDDATKDTYKTYRDLVPLLQSGPAPG